MLHKYIKKKHANKQRLLELKKEKKSCFCVITTTSATKLKCFPTSVYISEPNNVGSEYSNLSKIIEQLNIEI